MKTYRESAAANNARNSSSSRSCALSSVSMTKSMLRTIFSSHGFSDPGVLRQWSLMTTRAPGLSAGIRFCRILMA